VDSQRRLYALAGAMSVQTAELLKAQHRVVGAPGDVGDIPPRRRAQLGAAVRTYGAVAACCALTARLLLHERDAAGAGLDVLPVPPVVVVGANVLEPNPLSSWRATVRATAAALAELRDAKAAWSTLTDSADAELSAHVERMIQYVSEVGDILESSEPGAGSLKVNQREK